MAQATGNSGVVRVTKLIKVYKGTKLPVLDANGHKIIVDNVPSHPSYIPDKIDLCDCPVDDAGTGCVPTTTLPPTTTPMTTITTTTTTASICSLVLSWNQPNVVCNNNGTTTFTISVSGNNGHQVQFWDSNLSMFVDGQTANSYTFTVASNSQIVNTHARIKGCVTQISGSLQACSQTGTTGTTSTTPMTTTTLPTTSTTQPPTTTTTTGTTSTTVGTTTTQSICSLVLTWNNPQVTCNVNNTTTITISVSGNNGHQVQFWNVNTSMFVNGQTLNSYTFTVGSNSQTFGVHARIQGCVNEIEGFLQACSPTGTTGTTSTTPMTTQPPTTTTIPPTTTTIPPTTTTQGGCNYFSIQNTSNNTYNYTYPTSSFGTLSGILVGNTTVSICTSGGITSIIHTGSSSPLITQLGVILVGTSTCNCGTPPTTTTVGTTTVGTTTVGTTTAAPKLYYELAGCLPADYAYTLIAGAVGDRAVLPNAIPIFYTYTGATLLGSTPPFFYNGSIQHTNVQGCPPDPTTSTTTTAPSISFDLREVCQAGTEFAEISNIQGSVSGNEYSINYGSTWSQVNSSVFLFDVSGFVNQTIVVLVRDGAGTTTQRSLFVTDCVNVTTTTTTTTTGTTTTTTTTLPTTTTTEEPTTTTSAPNVMYYELGGCNPADYAYTTIFGNVGDRAVDSVTGVFYTYTGGTLFQNTVPPSYNGDIQHTGTTGCPPDPTTTTTSAPSLSFDATLICGGETEYIQISNIANGSGSYEYSINNGASWTGTGSNINVSGFVNQTVNVIVRDVNNTGSSASRSVFVSDCVNVTTTITTTTQEPTTTTTEVTTTTVVGCQDCRMGTIIDNNSYQFTDCVGNIFAGGAEAGTEICYDAGQLNFNIQNRGINTSICNCGQITGTSTTQSTTTIAQLAAPVLTVDNITGCDGDTFVFTITGFVAGAVVSVAFASGGVIGSGTDMTSLTYVAGTLPQNYVAFQEFGGDVSGVSNQITISKAGFCP